MPNSRLVYISTFIPPNIKDDVTSKMRNFNFNSADVFSYAILDGLIRNLGQDFDCINIAPVGAFPRFNRSAYFKKQEYIHNGVRINSIGFSTLYLYMYYSIYRNLFMALASDKRKEKKIFLIYSINLPVIRAVEKYIKLYSQESKIVLIVPDLVEDCVANSFLSRIRVRLAGNVQRAYNSTSGFVLLTKLMNERIKTSKPYCVVEGIYNKNEKRITSEQSNEIKTIFYSGMLYEKFGVKNLIDAFLSLDNSNYRLEICGSGELDSYIKEVAQKDTRIIFHGLVSREKVLDLQSRSTVLVNPRQPIEEFTKYSFPSKNIEYLAAGKPVLLYELPGIPEEYYSYCFHLTSQQLAIEDLANKLEEILKMDNDELSELGERAQKFILENKNSEIQVSKILKLCNLI